MSWIYEHQRNWRIALLVVMVVAFMGPWVFERLNVPAKYECSAPNIRLEGDFCGTPFSGMRVFAWFGGGIISISISLLSGEFISSGRIREFLIVFLLLFPLLPFFSTLLLTLRGEHPRRQALTIAAWILAMGSALYLGLNQSPNTFWKAWGIWLYTGLAVSALILEIIVLASEKDVGQGKGGM